MAYFKELFMKAVLCLYNKQNNTWALDKEFILCSNRYLTRSLWSLIRYQLEHSKINSISLRAYVLFSTYLFFFWGGGVGKNVLILLVSSSTHK